MTDEAGRGVDSSRWQTVTSSRIADHAMRIKDSKDIRGCFRRTNVEEEYDLSLVIGVEDGVKVGGKNGSRGVK